MGAAFRIAPNIPELAERVLITLLSLEATLKILRSTMGGGPEEKCLKKVFGEKCVFLKTLGMGLPCPGECLKRKVFEKGFAGSKSQEENVLRKTWD